MSAWSPPINSLQSTLEREKPQEGLYIVATPIGNIADITLRALHTLGNADLILCEDTRVSKKLLTFFGISTPLLAYHEHNAEKLRPKIIERLKSHQVIALISDAGTPLISDPGYKLVRECYENEIFVSALPGACSPIAALTLSGLPTDQFVFCGFIPSKSSARVSFYHSFKDLKSTLIFFETAPRLQNSLEDLSKTLGNRSICVARELTKKFEEIKRNSVDRLIEFYREKGAPKGEIVLIVEGHIQKTTVTDADIKRALEKLSLSSTLKDRVDKVTSDLQISRKRIYKLALEDRK